MYNSLTGEITYKGVDTLFLQSGDVEWDLAATATTIQSLPTLGSRVKVWVWLHHTEETHRYYAFASIQERALFLDLLKVNGVGPRAGLKFLSGMNWKDFASALEGGDTGKLSKIPGLGLKTAQKIVLALKGKLNLSGDPRSDQSSDWEELVFSLTEMGFEKKLVEKGVKEIAGDLGDLTREEKEKVLFQKTLTWLTGAEKRGR